MTCPQSPILKATELSDSGTHSNHQQTHSTPPFSYAVRSKVRRVFKLPMLALYP